MNVGKLNKRITIQKKLPSSALKDDEYEDFKTVWSNIINIHGKEFIEAQKLNSNISKKIVIRYIKDLDSSININASKDYRIAYKGNFYNILYIDNIKEECRYMEMMLEVE